MNVKIHRNFEVFTPTNFLAAITQHIPAKGVQMVRYFRDHVDDRCIHVRTEVIEGDEAHLSPLRDAFY
jgi:hypothetical protein